MAKPHHDWTGSGMHIHVSLVDSQGKNLFAGDPMAPMFRQAIGGLCQSMPDFMAIWAQSANAYRRYVPESYVPMAAHWGFNNRTVALRVPHGSGAATRIEHRVSGADANPFLVVAAILAGIRHGIDEGDRSWTARRRQRGDARRRRASDSLGELAREIPDIENRAGGIRRAVPGRLL